MSEITKAPTLDGLLDPGHRRDPYPDFDAWAAGAPVTELAEGLLLVAGRAECSAVLADPAFGHPDPAAGGDSAGTGFMKPPEVRSFLRMDPPDHTRLRRLVARAFTARRVQTLEPRVEELAADLVAELLDAPQPVDLMAGLATPLPVLVICELLGVPPQDRAQFTEWSHAVARGLDPEFLLSPQERDRLTQGREQLHDYFASLTAAKRAEPADDLISALVAVRDDGDQLSEQELLTTCTLLLIAGHETTVNLIGNGTLALLTRPAEQARLRADPSALPAAVEEMLRFDPPVQFTARMALSDTRIGDHTIAQGTQVMLALAAANRDPRATEEPTRFEPEREDARHLSFGHGIHFCLGAPLARLEARAAFAALLGRTTSLEPGGEPEWKDNLVLRGLDRLPVRAVVA